VAVKDGAKEVASDVGSGKQTVDIKAALMAAKGIDASHIDVNTNADTKTVTLEGTVPTAAQKTAVESVARDKAKGYRIRNLLTVAKPRVSEGTHGHELHSAGAHSPRRHRSRLRCRRQSDRRRGPRRAHRFDGPRFIGAVIGPWVAARLQLPEPFTVHISGHPFPVLWSIIGAALFVAIVHLFSRR